MRELAIEAAALDESFYGRGRMRRKSTRRDWRAERGSRVLPFVAWDGEGITYESNVAQSYVLFGCSLGAYVKAPKLTSAECLDLILNVERSNPDVIHVGFAFKYDVEMILVDLPVRSWYQLRRHGVVRWKGYRITYHPGKRFTVSRKLADAFGKEYRVTATIYDVWGFFQSSFIAALKGWLDPAELADIERIEAGKKERGNFRWEDLESYVIPYWKAELRLLVVLMDRLRDRLTSANVCPREWHGPGAIATAIYRQHEIRHSMSRTRRDSRNDSDLTIAALPERVNDAARIAYAGGRFEMLKVGHYEGTIYQYDINSAYPAAIAGLPQLSDGEWVTERNPAFRNDVFAVWRVEFDCWTPDRVSYSFPLFYRDKKRCVSFPLTVSGWYWTPEAALVAGSRYAHITECHVWVPRRNERPFAFVADMYAQRKEWKSVGNPAEKALKLALNSLYGKMAQRSGWQDKQPLPRYHQLEWAGYVTSYTRAVIFRAMNLAASNLIAVETDAVFTSKPLPQLPTGPELGLWEPTEHRFITYLQSGTYFTECPTCQGAGCEKCRDSGVKSKYRGLDSDSVTYGQVLQWLENGEWQLPIVGHTTRFIGSGRGLGTPFHRMWLTEQREIRPGATGKRMHLPKLCPLCERGVSARESMHPTLVMTRGGESQPHDLPWLGEPKDDPFRKETAEVRYDMAGVF